MVVPGRAFEFFSFAVGLRMGFHGLLRPRELAQQIRGTILTPADTGGMEQRLVLVVFNPKNWAHVGRQQS
eukprot:11836616-Alexandrium_andersonii.AAC.1